MGEEAKIVRVVHFRSTWLELTRAAAPDGERGEHREDKHLEGPKHMAGDKEIPVQAWLLNSYSERSARLPRGFCCGYEAAMETSTCAYSVNTSWTVSSHPRSELAPFLEACERGGHGKWSWPSWRSQA